jgi:hypothetical protein
MATKDVGLPRSVHAVTDELLVLGGSPLPAAGPPGDADDKETHRHRKREAKLRRDAVRPPESFERFRILAELVDQGRQVVELADHKARYALVVIGVLNAGVFFIISRGHLLADLPQSIKPWLVGLVVIYSALTFIFMYYAVECLRPRRMPYLGVMVANDGIDTPAALHGPRGILFWETIAKYELDAYRRAWASVRMEQLNAEVVVIAHQQARLIRSKYAALQWLFRGLAVLLVLAGVLLAVYAGFGLAG